jgi:hypothetical protein
MGESGVQPWASKTWDLVARKRRTEEGCSTRTWMAALAQTAAMPAVRQARAKRRRVGREAAAWRASAAAKAEVQWAPMRRSSREAVGLRSGRAVAASAPVRKRMEGSWPGREVGGRERQSRAEVRRVRRSRTRARAGVMAMTGVSMREGSPDQKGKLSKEDWARVRTSATRSPARGSVARLGEGAGVGAGVVRVCLLRNRGRWRRSTRRRRRRGA